MFFIQYFKNSVYMLDPHGMLFTKHGFEKMKIVLKEFFKLLIQKELNGKGG